MTQDKAPIHLPPSSITAQHSLSDDLRFLAACCQSEPAPEDIDLINAYLSQPLSPSLITAASRHGVIPLVYKTLKKLDESNLLNAERLTLSAFKAAYMQIARRNMLMSAELLRVMKLLEENGIEALAFKGPTLAQQAYGDITLRQFGDLDILVSEKEAVAAGTLLSENGYRPVSSIKALENRTCLRVMNDLGFRHEDSGVLVELHWRLFRERIGRHLGFMQIGENSCTVTINGRTVRKLSPEMQLVYLCLHGSKHAWERLEWICDIDRLLRSQTEIDWDKTRKIAEAMDTQTTLQLALVLCRELFRTPLPEAVASMTRSNRVEELAEKTYELLSVLPKLDGYARYGAIHRYQNAVLDTGWKKVRHFLSINFGISKNDCEAFPLPSSLTFLYLFIKPFRIALKLLRRGA